jgi:hypothetical protein
LDFLDDGDKGLRRRRFGVLRNQQVSAVFLAHLVPFLVMTVLTPLSARALTVKLRPALCTAPPLVPVLVRLRGVPVPT